MTVTVIYLVIKGLKSVTFGCLIYGMIYVGKLREDLIYNYCDLFRFEKAGWLSGINFC